MSRPRLSVALAASAALHLLVLALLLGRAHGGAPALAPMHVALVTPGAAPAAVARPGTGEAPAPPRAAAPSPVRTGPAHPAVRAARRQEPEKGQTGDETPAAAVAPAIAQLTPVQSDISVLGAPAATGAPPAAGTASTASSAGATEPMGSGEGTGAATTGTGPPGGASLLTLLSQRLAWSAERCAPPSLVRLARHAVPGVPLYFCLDAAGQPSKVGLLGTTGSEQLDRAARDCVVPGALPLPPAPGCYTVEVRFPVRG